MSVVIYADFKLKRVTEGPVSVDPSVPDPAWSFESIKERLRARFGDTMPPHFERAWLRRSREPYAYGSVDNVSYRTVRPKYWNAPMPVPMDMDPRSDVIGRGVARGGSDPCMWMDAKYRVTWNHIHNRHGKPLVVHTRSDLIAHGDYLEVLDPVHHRVVMYVLDAVEEVVRIMEPGAPSLKRRRLAVDKLISRGIPVQVVHIPVTHQQIVRAKHLGE